MDWIRSIKDPQMLKVISMANNIASRKATVLIYGESGVGKELLSRYIHESSSRKDSPFMAVNCAAVPENLLESELFGHEKGAFTGAHQLKIGKFEKANKGTFLLDEISELPLILQGKLLRVLQESELERLGGTQTQKIDVRFICTSNRDLKKMVREKKFREDLFYRLNVIPLEIPPLRLRKRDIVSLIQFFNAKITAENNMNPVSISQEGIRKMLNWGWPGNIRELQNVMERSLLLGPEGELKASDIQIENFEEKQGASEERGFIKTGMTIHEAERRLILKTLEQTQQNRTHAARILGISIRTLRNKLNEYRDVSMTTVGGINEL